MNPDTITAIQKALAPVAEKIGEGAAYGWEIAVRQQYIVAIQDFSMAFVGMIMLVLGIFTARYSYKKLVGERGYYSGNFPVAPTLTLLLFGAGGVMFAYGLTDGVAHILNPGFYALQFFIDIASGNTAN